MMTSKMASGQFSVLEDHTGRHQGPTLTVFPAGINPLCGLGDLADFEETGASSGSVVAAAPLARCPTHSLR